ncbi:T9SS type A sorting domain-containing protein [Olleya sp. HaHaR_3_96]|uniref:T9SS type A sorting domain-containing protein n=1 Tax=Olleya sp. HaHaR_3_96 TaxID=2745560 RepID=UPI001C4F7834|nr:T9SS type A sorting domain-containing protein [Olleya sp. HaHaR_3_96]QXP59629.1 T9SS type A sorting domain-containing protein [Olleya sp. HaHaR_3_96]
MKYIIQFSIIVFTIIAQGQGTSDKWYFGNEAGLDFSTGSPIEITDSLMNSIESCASVSDTFGNLLFYTDGVNVWDSNNNVTPNGTGLFGNVSTSQILIIQKPKTEGMYYIFYADAFGGPNGLRYSEMNMNLNNGNGDIVNTTKNTLLHLNASEKMSAINHCDGSDIWLATLNFSNNNFYIYKISETGIEQPIISNSGNIDDSCCHTMKFSPNGSFLAYTNNFSGNGDDSKLYSFNALTGIITFHSNLPRNINNLENNYGLSFSPDNSKLYISSGYNLTSQGVTNVLYQYDMESLDIPSTKTIIFEELFPNQGVNPTPFGSLQNGPDGKIYLARWSANLSVNSLGVINNPNAQGSSCNFQLEGVSLGGKSSLLGLPNFNESYFNQSNPITCDELSIDENIKEKLKIFPNPFTVNLNVEFVNQENEINIKLYSILGKLVLEDTYFNKKQLQINTSSLREGVYFLKISTKNRSSTLKIVKS